jgi:triacylglycerol lipase
MQVYLVPGFFGFASLGSLSYFQRVADVLRRGLQRHGLDAEIIEVNTRPTSSLRRRALMLLEEVRVRGGLEHGSVHFVGHSTGGLDVRLLLTPGVRLAHTTVEDAIGERTKSVVMLAAPNFGTPLANFFAGLQGRNLLYILTAMATSGPGRLGIFATARLLSMIARLDDFLGQRETLLDTIAERLLHDITAERNHALYEFLRCIASDQGAMVQLTPESTDLFNAAVGDRDGVDYVSFVTAAPPPTLRPRGHDVYAYATSLLFGLSYAIARREHRHYPYPWDGSGVSTEIAKALPFELHAGSNDGIVPTLSQIWGRLGGVAVADHLDVVGQFPHECEGRKYPGWLCSGASFDDSRFEALWFRIADVIATAELGARDRSQKDRAAEGRERPVPHLVPG